MGGDHFEQVLNRPEPSNPPNLTEGPELPIRTGSIIKSEIREALKSLKNGTAAGPDSIPAEAIELRREEISQCPTWLPKRNLEDGGSIRELDNRSTD